MLEFDCFRENRLYNIANHSTNIFFARCYIVGMSKDITIFKKMI